MVNKIKVLRLLSRTSNIPSVKQGAVQTGVLKTTNLQKEELEIYVLSGWEKGQNLYENIDGVHFLRIRPVFNWLFKLLGREDSLYIRSASVIIKELNPDVVHIHNRPGYILFLKKMIGSKYKLVLHEHNHNLKDMFSRKKAKRIIDNVDAVVEISNYSAEYDIFADNPDTQEKVVVINRGVDTKEFRPSRSMEEKEKIKKKYNLVGKKIVLFTGAIRKRKGVHLVVDAFTEIAEKHKDAVLLVVGGSAKNTEAKDSFALNVIKKMDKLGSQAKSLGFVPYKDLPEIYRMSDVYCAPSVWNEPFGLVFVEAMASALPVVTSSKGGIPEIIDDGISGYVVSNPEENIIEISNKLDLLLSDDMMAKSFGKNGRKRVEKYFTWKASSEKLTELYKKIM